jgi:hypothetical protein
LDRPVLTSPAIQRIERRERHLVIEFGHGGGELRVERVARALDQRARDLAEGRHLEADRGDQRRRQGAVGAVGDPRELTQEERVAAALAHDALAHRGVADVRDDRVRVVAAHRCEALQRGRHLPMTAEAFAHRHRAGRAGQLAERVAHHPPKGMSRSCSTPRPATTRRPAARARGPISASSALLPSPPRPAAAAPGRNRGALLRSRAWPQPAGDRAPATR